MDRIERQAKQSKYTAGALNGSFRKKQKKKKVILVDVCGFLVISDSCFEIIISIGV